MTETVEQFLDRFWKNVYKDSEDKCWLWFGGTNGGYGWFSIGNRPWHTHVVSYYLYYKELPEHPFHVLHKCNNKLCVNPKHLYKGTEKDNKRDQIERDGIRSGGRKKKLSGEQIDKVFKLRNEGYEQREIARMMRVSQWNIWNILNNSER